MMDQEMLAILKESAVDDLEKALLDVAMELAKLRAHVETIYGIDPTDELGVNLLVMVNQAQRKVERRLPVKLERKDSSTNDTTGETK